MTDTTADFFIRIKNGYMAKKETIAVPYSKTKDALAHVLLKAGYLAKVELKDEKKVQKKHLILTLLYQNKTPRVENLHIVSRKSRKIYVKKDSIPNVLGGLGCVILSTSRGIMTGKQAKKQKLGGELLCKIW